MALLNYDILNKMKKHFARWLDIRRRSTSTGSYVLESISDEIEDINTAIEEYKKDFFISNYLNKEDDVIDFIYKTNIGVIEDKSFVLLTPNIKVVSSQDEFYNNKDVCLYSDGILYFRKYYNNVEYLIDKYKSTATLEKMHVWNIYDEFAVFVGLRRYIDETNKELLKRILNKSNSTINSSEEGLKTAIVNNLINIVPELKKEDIKIERPTPENLLQYYNEFETILDHLNSINRDVYENKKWDIDTWNFKFKSVDYIPQPWDIVLPEYLNGIGDNDDLKISIIDNNKTTDAEIKFYKKDKQAINSYVKNNKSKAINFDLKRYNESIVLQNVKYRITASEVQELNPQNIIITCSEEKTSNNEIPIEDIVNPDSLTNIKIEDKSILDSKYKYKLRFVPNKKIGNFRILKCMQQNGDEEPINLLTEKTGFKFLNNYKKSIGLGRVSDYIINKYQFDDYYNIKKDIDGFKIEDGSSEGLLSIDVKGKHNEKIYYDYTVKEVPFIFNDIERNNCYVKNNSIIADTVSDTKFIKINKNLNSISFEIKGPFLLEYSIDNNGIMPITKIENESYVFKIDKKNKQFNLSLKLTFLDSTGSISNINYTKYDFIVKVDNKEISAVSGFSLPDKCDIFSIEIKTYTGFSPVLKYIYIGDYLDDSDFYGDIDFNPSKGQRLITRFEDCKLILKKYDLNGNFIEDIDDYKPYKFYSPKDSNELLEVNLKNYVNINNISVNNGSIETYSSNSQNSYNIKLNAANKIFSVSVMGTSKEIVNKNTLENILKIKGYNPTENKFYITKNIDKIIVQNTIDKKYKFEYISKRDVFNEYNISSISIDTGNDVYAKFIERLSENSGEFKTVSISNTFNNNFDFLTFVPSGSKVYTAINSHNMVTTMSNEIEIVNTFNNNYDDSKRMFYTIESLNDNYYVLFNSKENTSLDKNTIFIKLKNSDDIDCDYEKFTIQCTMPLGTRIDIPELLPSNDNEQIDIRKYIITNKDLKIIYKDKNSTDNPNDFLIEENFYINNIGFNKLLYSNVTEIVSLIVDTFDDNNERVTITLNEGKDFLLKKDEGIIIWLNKSLLNSSTSIRINYYIKIASAIEIDLDELYENIKFNTDALIFLNKITLEKIEKNQSIDLSIYDLYKNSDLVTVTCSEPGFTTSINNDILKFTKNISKNNIAIKTGYYYMDGNEYYMFANKNYDNIDNIDNVYLNNVIKSNKKFLLKQQTTNYITNSSLSLNSINNIYELDCKDKEIQGSSKLNELMACETYNYWNSVSANLSIVKGLNGQGIKVTPLNNTIGYAYLSLNHFLTTSGIYTLSFFLSGSKSRAYLGKERVVYSANSIFNQESIIDIVCEIKPSEINSNIYENEIMYKEYTDEIYYLIITNESIIDDIIVAKKNEYNIDMHTKNLSYLNFDIDENIYTSYKERLYLTDTIGINTDGIEVDKDLNIFNSSYIDWGFTKYKAINTYNDFKKCELKNVNLLQYNNKCILKTESEKGTICTNVLYIGNTKIIKNLLLKVNNVMFDNMKDFKIKVYASESRNNLFKNISQHLDNIGCINGEILSPYIKIIIEMPPNKVINNIDIFIEYLSNDEYSPSDVSVLSGTYVSKVLDSQYNEKYRIKTLSISNNNRSLDKYKFEIRASKENSEKTVWTNWKEIQLVNDYEDVSKSNIKNKIIFDGYRYFQFKLTLNGESSSIKLNYLDIEVV